MSSNDYFVQYSYWLVVLGFAAFGSAILLNAIVMVYFCFPNTFDRYFGPVVCSCPCHYHHCTEKALGHRKEGAGKEWEKWEGEGNA